MMRRVSVTVSGKPWRMHHSRPGDTRSFTRSTLSAVIRSPGATSACAAHARTAAASTPTRQGIRELSKRLRRSLPCSPPRRRGPQPDGERKPVALNVAGSLGRSSGHAGRPGELRAPRRPRAGGGHPLLVGRPRGRLRLPRGDGALRRAPGRHEAGGAGHEHRGGERGYGPMVVGRARAVGAALAALRGLRPGRVRGRRCRAAGRGLSPRAGLLAAVAVVGGLYGSWLGARRLPPLALRRLLAAVLLIAGGRLALGG